MQVNVLLVMPLILFWSIPVLFAASLANLNGLTGISWLSWLKRMNNGACKTSC
jgi:hypothetical protein